MVFTTSSKHAPGALTALRVFDSRLASRCGFRDALAGTCPRRLLTSASTSGLTEGTTRHAILVPSRCSRAWRPASATAKIADCRAITRASLRARGNTAYARASRKKPGAFILLSAVFAATIAFCYRNARTLSSDATVFPLSATQDDPDLTLSPSLETEEGTLRKIRLTELPNHDGSAAAKWVTRGTKVYDITEFVESHPGGEVILRACGSSIDEYWNIIAIHQKKEVHDLLDQFYIGDIDQQDLDPNGNIDWSLVGYRNIGDLFKDEPARDEELIMHTAKPCNAETPGSLLTDFLTPIHLFFVRNHLWVPRIETEKHELLIELSNGDEKAYLLSDLKDRFQWHTITVTLQCAGNRRKHMSKSPNGPTSGLQWDTGAIGTAEFTGVRLRDVLQDCGYDVDGICQGQSPEGCTDKHVHFAAPSDTYAASIPLQTALSPTSDVLLAWDMNGKPLNRDHGGPLRTIVPGSISARSVKWVGRITVSEEEATSQWQRRDYKVFPPDVQAKDVTSADWDNQHSIQEMVVQSAISSIRPNETQTSICAKGWAVGGGGRAIVRVEVSPDGGKTWKQARLSGDEAKGMRRWAWTLWSAEWSLEELKAMGMEGRREFVCRAVDEAFNTQPENFDSTWNFRGLCASAWHRVETPQ